MNSALIYSLALIITRSVLQGCPLWVKRQELIPAAALYCGRCHGYNTTPALCCLPRFPHQYKEPNDTSFGEQGLLLPCLQHGNTSFPNPSSLWRSNNFWLFLGRNLALLGWRWKCRVRQRTWNPVMVWSSFCCYLVCWDGECLPRYICAVHGTTKSPWRISRGAGWGSEELSPSHVLVGVHVLCLPAPAPRFGSELPGTTRNVLMHRRACSTPPQLRAN